MTSNPKQITWATRLYDFLDAKRGLEAGKRAAFIRDAYAAAA